MPKKAAFGRITVGANIVASVRNWRQPNESTEIDVSVMGTGKGAMIPGTTNEDVEVDLLWEYADAGQAYLLANLGTDATHAVVLQPEGQGTGLPEWTADCYIMNATPEGTVDGAIEMNGVRLVSDSAGGSWGSQP